MSMDRTIVVRVKQQAEAACQHIMGNWEAMREDGRTLACRVFEYKENRSLEQQSLMWLRLADIAEQVWVRGRQYADKTWHEYFKEQHLPEEPGPSRDARKGYQKWVDLPNGERRLAGSTTQLTVAGMADYLTRLEAWGAKMAVRFSASPAEAAGYR